MSLDGANLEEIISIDNDVPMIEFMRDFELIKSVTQNCEILNFQNSEISENDEIIFTKKQIEILKKAIRELERRAYISKDEITYLVVKNKPSMLQKKNWMTY